MIKLILLVQQNKIKNKLKNDKSYQDQVWNSIGGSNSSTQVAGVNYDLDNWIDKTYGSGASNWYRQSGGKIEGNPFIPAGSYIPKAQKGSKSKTQVAHYNIQGRLLSESKRSILKNLKKPVVIPETKQKKYKVKPKIRGLHPESKPSISKPVAPKEYKKIGGRNLWGQYEHEQNSRASQERMNSVYELLGDGWMAQEHMLTNSKRLNAEEMEKFWGLHPELYSYFYNGKKYTATRKEEIKGDYLVFLVDENGEKSSILQSELNEKLAEEKEKKELEEYNELNPKAKRNNRVSYEKDPLFKKVAKRLKKEINYPDKPAKMGYPNDPPPEMVNDRHPDFGKRPGTTLYNKMSPKTAKAMPFQDDPVIDDKIKKARAQAE